MSSLGTVARAGNRSLSLTIIVYQCEGGNNETVLTLLDSEHRIALLGWMQGLYRYYGKRQKHFFLSLREPLKDLAELRERVAFALFQ